jgi:hypothetical protein
VNANGSIDIVDALRVAQYYVGLVTELSCSTTQTPVPTATPVSGCVHSEVKANEVIWIGDSWIMIPGDQHNRVRDLAWAAGTIRPNEDYVELAVSGSPIATIVNQYNTREAGSVKVILIDSGGIDFIQGGDSAIPNVVNTFNQFLDKVRSDGTVQHIVYFHYPDLMSIPCLGTMWSAMRQDCAGSPVPCYFLDLQPLFAGRPEYIGSDTIHPSLAGAIVIGEAIWYIMQQNCIAR